MSHCYKNCLDRCDNFCPSFYLKVITLCSPTLSLSLIYCHVTDITLYCLTHHSQQYSIIINHCHTPSEIQYSSNYFSYLNKSKSVTEEKENVEKNSHWPHYLPFDWISLTMDDCVWSYNTIWRRVCLNHLELNSTHATTYNESIILVNRTVSLKEVWLQIHFKQVSAQI